MRRWPLVIAGAVILCSASEGLADPGADRVGLEVVTTLSGDRLNGQVLAIGADGVLRLSGPGLVGEAGVLVSGLDRVKLGGKEQGSAGHEVVLSNGDNLAGTITAITPEVVVIESEVCGLLKVSRKVVSSISFAGVRTTSVSSRFSLGTMEPWKVAPFVGFGGMVPPGALGGWGGPANRGWIQQPGEVMAHPGPLGTWEIKNGQLVSSGSGGNLPVFAELAQDKAFTFVAKVKATGANLGCDLVVFADDIAGSFGRGGQPVLRIHGGRGRIIDGFGGPGLGGPPYGKNSIYAQFRAGKCRIGQQRNARGAIIASGPGVKAGVKEAELRLAYDPATGRAMAWIDSEKVVETTLAKKVKPTKGKYVIFYSQTPVQISYLRVLRGVVPPSGGSGENMVRFANEDSLSVKSVSLAEGSLAAETAYGQVRCAIKKVQSISFSAKGRQEPRRQKSDVLIETQSSRFIVQFKELTGEYLLGQAEHLGKVKVRRTAIRSIRFNIHR